MYVSAYRCLVVVKYRRRTRRMLMNGPTMLASGVSGAVFQVCCALLLLKCQLLFY